MNNKEMAKELAKKAMEKITNKSAEQNEPNIEYQCLNTSIPHDRIIEDALYFFPNADSTKYVSQIIPSPYSYPVLDFFTTGVSAAAHSAKAMGVSKETFKNTFEEEYKYWYFKENKNILIDHTASVIVTNVTNILFNGSLMPIYHSSPDYSFRYPFAINQYEISSLIVDFMESTEFIGERLPENDLNILLDMNSTLALLISQIMRLISEKINDYVRQIIFDPNYPIVNLIMICESSGKHEIFNAIDKKNYNTMISENYDTLYMLAYGCIQDLINEDMLKISETLEANIVFLHNQLTNIYLAYNSN